MNENTFHIIITGESGCGRTLLVKKKSLRTVLVSAVLLILLLCIGTVAGLHQRKDLLALEQQIASLTLSIDGEGTDAVSQLSNALTEARNELTRVELEKIQLAKRYEEEVDQLKQNQTELFEGSISRLDERSKIIKTMMDQIGVKIEVEEDPNHSGGLYVDPDSMLSDKLIDKTDRYLELVKKLPLGRPINTKISSRYGRRSDPLNHKKAFHFGVDFKGRTGDKVAATGDAVVKVSSYNKGMGKYVILKHVNGYETLYAHMSKRLVKRGQKVTRGQAIGLVGNTGRSTGSHLHYEVHYRNKTVNPMKFMQVSKLLSSK